MLPVKALASRPPVQISGSPCIYIPCTQQGNCSRQYAIDIVSIPCWFPLELYKCLFPCLPSRLDFSLRASQYSRHKLVDF